MRIFLAQTNQKVGDIRGNTDKILAVLKKFKADLYVFPELTITGYVPNDLLLKRRFIEENLSAFERIIKNSRGKTIILGFIDRIKEKIYNSAAIIQNSSLLGIYRKQHLPNYHIFDEKRWFSQGNNPEIFDVCGKIIGINICEDIWFPETARKQKELGAGLIINISASPYSEGKIEKIEKILKGRWDETGIPILFVNQVGSQDGIVYYGHSMFFDNGRIIKKAKDFEEEILIVEV